MPFRLPADGVFEGDASALTWWLASHRPSRDSPERRLCWAVLEDAIGCLRRPVRPVPRHVDYSTFAPREHAVAREEARRWIASGDVTWPFSFVNLCGVLGLEPDWIRRQIARMPPQTGGSGRPKVYSESGDRVTAGVARSKSEAAQQRATPWSGLGRGAG